LTQVGGLFFLPSHFHKAVLVL